MYQFASANVCKENAMSERKKLTVAELAKEVGVSPATVSRVLNHSHMVNQSTYDKVMEAIDRLGYELPESQGMTLLRRTDSNIVVVNISSHMDTDCAEYMNGIQTSAYRYDWVPTLTQNPLDWRSVDSYIKALQTMRAAGLIVLNHVQKDILERINTELPVIQCGEFNEDAHIPYVGIDDFAAARKVVSHLISRGATRISFINAPSRFRFARERRRGYEQALRDAGMKPNPADIVELSDASFAMAHAFISPTLSFSSRPDAIFAATDTIAYAAIIAAREQGLRVPEDISIAGFDNKDISIMSIPKITTVSQPRFQLGFVACEMLHEQCINQTRPHNLTLNTELIIRDSTK